MKNINSPTKWFQIGVFLILLAYLVTVLIASYEKARLASAVDLTRLTPTEMVTLSETRSPIINAVNFLQPTLTWVAAILGIMWSIMTFEDGRRRDREQRLDLEKEKDKERLLQEVQLSLANIWAGISSKNEGDRSGSIARLLFLIDLASNAEKGLDQTVKIQIASMLAHVGRQDNSKQTVETLTMVVVKAFKEFGHQITSQVSWQGLHLISPDFSGNRHLEKLDFREAVLEDAKFDFCDLSGTNFRQARLNGATFANSVLREVNLQFADLAGASFANSDLSGSDLRRALWRDTDLSKANLDRAKLSEFVDAWRLTRNWQTAKNLAGRFRKLLVETYGDTPKHDKAILMIAWEFPPFVSGGGWTALFHLTYNLIRKGWPIILVTPWPKEFIDYTAFGNLVEVISVFDKDSAPLSAYAAIYQGVYSDLPAYQPNLALDTGKQIGLGRLKDPSIVSMAERFANNVAHWIEKRILDEYGDETLPIGLIYSHDWLCARAAKLAKSAISSNRPKVDTKWFAHFHSLESDRQNKDARSKMIETIERETAAEADVVITPSHRTATKIIKEYGNREVFVLPNYLSNIEDLDYGLVKSTNLGEFDSKIVVFIGRIGWQKGPDIFVRLASKVLNAYKGSIKPRFVMYGRGPMEREVGELINSYFPQKPYDYKALGLGSHADLPRELSNINPVVIEGGLESNPPHIADRYGELREVQARIVENTLFDRGFLAYRVQGEQPYTHLVQMNDLGDGWHLDYLVEAAGFPPPKYLRERSVELMGNVTWKERFEAFRGATVVVVPSRNEPYGMVIVEALKCGVPVIYTNEAGVAELLSGQVGAWTITDEDGMATEICNLLKDYAYWESVLEKQREQFKNLQGGPAFDEFLKLLEVYS